MEKAGKTRAPWRSWTILALVLGALALGQACSDSSSRTSGPTKSTAVALKVRRVAQVPPNCTGTLIVDGQNGFHVEIAIPTSGQVSFQAPIGVLLTLTVILNCGAQGTFTGSTSFTAGPGNNDASVTVVATQAGVACSPGTVAPGQSSNCVCIINSPTPPTVTWTGANPTGPTTAAFSNSTPGTYAVTCTVNNAVSASTTVTVQPVTVQPPVQNGTIQVTNTFQQFFLRPRKVLAQLGQGAFLARVVKLPSGPVSAAQEVQPGQTVRFDNLPPGDYRVEFSCSTSFAPPSDTEHVSLPAGGTITVERNWGSLCG